jgi:hypothetical protein
MRVMCYRCFVTTPAHWAPGAFTLLPQTRHPGHACGVTISALPRSVGRSA